MHTVVCNFEADRPYQYTAGGNVNAEAQITCSPTPLTSLVEQGCSLGLLRHAWGMVSSLLPFFDQHHYLDDMGRVSRLLLAAAVDQSDAEAEAYAHWGLGEWHSYPNRYAAGARELTVARRMLDELGHVRSEAAVLSTLVSVCRLLGRLELSESLAREMLELARTIGDTDLLALGEHDLGVLAMERGDLAEARARFDDAVATFIASGNLKAEGLVQLRLGVLNLMLGHDDEATTRLHRSLAVSRLLGYRMGEAYGLLALHDAYQRQSRDQEAAAAAEDSLRLFRQLRHPLGEARALIVRARRLRQQGQPASAERELRRALRRISSTGVRRWEATIRAALDDVLTEAEQQR